MDYGRLPVTGGGIAIGALAINQMWLLGIGFGLVAVGTLAIRFGWRRGKEMSDA